MLKFIILIILTGVAAAAVALKTASAYQNDNTDGGF